MMLLAIDAIGKLEFEKDMRYRIQDTRYFLNKPLLERYVTFSVMKVRISCIPYLVSYISRSAKFQFAEYNTIL